MTGRELIVYILENGLEDEDVFKKGNFVGFVSDGEACEMLNSGLSTIHCLAKVGEIDHIYIKNAGYIPVTDLKRYLKNKEVADKHARI